MIYIKTRGRLGNQMFYYAFARAIQKENPDLGEIVFIPDEQVFEKYGGLTILDFNVNIKGVAKKPELSLKQKGIYLIFKICRKACEKLKGAGSVRTLTIRSQPILNAFGLYVGWFSDDVKIRYNSNSKNVWVTGLWENPVYFHNIKSILKSEFTPRYDLLPHNENMLNDILTTNSVCVSIRRGDYLDKGNEVFNICTKEYFYEAERTIAKIMDTYKLFIFSDDVEWCKHNMHFQGPVSFENNAEDAPVWEKMRLMSACKHFIISNSTFSWWAQYLSDNPEKKVIAPRPWRKNEYCDCFYDESFILLDVSSGKLAIRET